MSNNPHVQTQRLLLRPLRLSDAPDIFLMRSRLEVMQWTTATAVETTLQQSIDWIQQKTLNRADETLNLAMELLAPAPAPTEGENVRRNRVIGVVGAVRGPEIGYMLHPDFWNQGVASEALAGFIPLFWSCVPQAPRVSKGLQTTETVGNVADPRAVLGNVTADEKNAAIIPSAVSSSHDTPQKLCAGFDYMEAVIDPENIGSARVLQKSGFTLWRTAKDDFHSPFLGLRSTAVYRLPRPGTSLELAPVDDSIDH